MEEIRNAVKIIGSLVDVLHCDASTKALIVSSHGGDYDNGFFVGKLIYQQIMQRGGKALQVGYVPRTWDEPRDMAVAELMHSDFNLLIVTDVDNLGYDPIGRKTPYKLEENVFNDVIYYRKAKKDLSAYWFMVRNLDIWLKTVAIDYLELAKISRKLEEQYRQAEKITFISGGKYTLIFRLKQTAQPIADYNGASVALGQGCNIPFGEVLVTPDMSTSEGTIAIDGSWYSDYTVTLKKPLLLTFHEGMLVDIAGEEKKELEYTLAKEKRKTEKEMKINTHITPEYVTNLFRIGEFAIGLNPKAFFCDDLLIDEKVYGTAHIALGRSYHGDPSLMHCDLVVKNPEIIFTDKKGKQMTIVKNRKIFL